MINEKIYNYTKIQVPITLKEGISDYQDSRRYIDVNIDNFCQQECYIGMQRIEKICIQRIKKGKNKEGISAPRWEVEAIIAEKKNEDEAIEIINSLCEILSLACAKNYKCFQNSGFYGFAFLSMDIKRSYAGENQVFGEKDFNYRCGYVKMTEISNIEKNIFELPKIEISYSELLQRLNKAFLIALRSGDAVSRYILLYYLFEIMYETPEYQNLKKEYDKNNIQKKDNNKKRSEILLKYLQNEFRIREYYHFGKKEDLTSTILADIINTRNELVHRADISKISELMYHHLIPILQRVLEK